LVSTLPADFPAPIVVAQHLDPRRASHLEAILGRQARLSVRTVGDRQQLVTGTLYVVPSNRHVEVLDGHVRLVEEGAGRSQPSIDLLMTSAAEAYGEHLTAVILTGSGSDGAEGARRVKARGGTVIVQDPATAQFPSMPRSLAPTTVDITAQLESIGPLLVELLTTSPADNEDGVEAGELEAFLDRVRDQSGIDFGSYKRPTIMRRLQRRITATGSSNLAQYAEHLEHHPDELQRLTSSFLLKVTEFFRDPALFERLRAEWLPELVNDARRRGEELRVWSAGSATGEEAYSLALLVAEALDQEDRSVLARIFATDLDDAAIGFARRGVYPTAAFENVPPELRERYVSVFDGDSEIVKDVRSLVVFGQHDLGQRAPFPRMDLVLCRNVLIYFQPALQERALRLFAFSLREGGYLALGKAETTAAMRGSFTLVDRALKVYRRTGNREALPPLHLTQPSRTAQPFVPPRSPAPALDLAVIRARRDADQKRALADRADRVLLGMQTGIVVVDDRYDILRINASARELLSIHGSAVGDDFVHLAVGLASSELRVLIDAALRGEAARSVFSLTTSATDSGEAAQIEVSCIRVTSDPAAAASVVVELRDITASESHRLLLEDQLTESRAEAERVRTLQARESDERVEALTDELAERDRRLVQQADNLSRSADTHRQVIAANRELTDANAILGATNDELLIASEEAQASTEEVETLNEELQATNEELETLNEELQATIEELNATNSELEARTVEIEEANEALAAARSRSERQRQRLATTMSSMGDAVMMVDERGDSLLTNEVYDELFVGVDDDSTVAIEGGEPMPSRDALQRRAASGETFLTQFALRAPDGSRRWFEAHGRPLRGDEGERGGVVAIRDITDRSLRELQDQFVAMVAHELRTPLTAMSGYVELLRRHLPETTDDDQLHRYADRAVAQARRMADLVRDLLDANRLQRGGLDYAHEPVDLASLVEEMVEVTRPMSEGIELRLTGASAPVWVIGDAGRLQQVVLNLLSNATRHGAGGGRVDVSLRRGDTEVALKVRDRGAGIPEAELPNLFTRFYQGAGGAHSGSGGMGLGLYISREITEAHGGTIVVRSRPGHGATFVVTLPTADAPTVQP
ncbi:MAG: ATP-binding protein, partial [Chloroflexota bacterium]|nr:ATP-binding protein [Chloroflexota bacterium]